MSIVSILALIVFLPLMLLAVQNITVLITRATGTPATIVVDAKTVLEPIDTNFYHAFSQGGEESGDMLAPVVGVLKALRPRVIRLDHLYDHYSVQVNGDGTVTGWGSLDGAVDSILATGARPILVLSYMPASIAAAGSIINPPNDWNAWGRVVQQTIEHFSGTGGKNISGIYYEVWNEPDLAQFGKWTPQAYVTLYRYASVGARLAANVNTFYLGGPSTTGLYKTWIMALIQSGARINFLSWHTYQTDPAVYDRDQRNIIEWLLPYPNYTLIPKLITEFGFTGDKNPQYGTSYAAAHAAAVIGKLITGSPTYLLSFQPVDGPGQQSGNGWGLITHPDNGLKKKPRYYVYNFIDGMAGNRLPLSGEGTWVTGFASIKNSVVRVMLTNFRGFTEHVPVTFTNVDPGTYTLRLKYLFGSDTKVPVAVADTTYQTTVPLTPNNVVILELSKTP
jgi:hypothetical protein